MANPATGALRQSGSLFALVLDTLRALPRRPFQTKEFIQQCWFIASVTIVPTALVSIPFGAVAMAASSAHAGPQRPAPKTPSATRLT